MNKVKLTPPNFTLAFGEPKFGLSFNFTVKKTLLNRLKWQLFCKVFPCRIKEWKDE